MKTTLQAKGYSFYYEEFSGGHDYVCWRGSLSNGLQILTGKVQNLEEIDEAPPWAPIPD